MPSYGRYAVPESPARLASLHFHDGGPLHEVTHEPKVAVLDQEDLFAQGIYVSHLVHGATDVDALGDCTANATMAALSNLLPEDEFLHFATAGSYEDTKNAEIGAILFYAECTHQTGTPQTEWPPTDCGSSGPYIVSELERLQLIEGDTLAHGATSLVSLMQRTGVLAGIPYFTAWEQPDAAGFVDGDGSPEALQAAVRSGLAGGHEVYLSAVEKVALTETGVVIPEKTVIRFRNSWSARWGDHGSGRFHLSTLVAIGAYADFRQLVV